MSHTYGRHVDPARLVAGQLRSTLKVLVHSGGKPVGAGVGELSPLLLLSHPPVTMSAIIAIEEISTIRPEVRSINASPAFFISTPPLNDSLINTIIKQSNN